MKHLMCCLKRAMYYYAFVSWGAATILYHSKQGVEAMWGRLTTKCRLLCIVKRYWAQPDQA